MPVLADIFSSVLASDLLADKLCACAGQVAAADAAVVQPLAAGRRLRVPGAALSFTGSLLACAHTFSPHLCCVQDNSLLQMPPWCNPWLLVAGGVSLGLHFVILYVPVLADIFSIVPLSAPEWGLVLLFSFPVIIIDEVRSCSCC